MVIQTGNYSNQVCNGGLGPKEKETYLTRFECTYLATSQMIRVNDKCKSKMAEIL